MAESVISPRQQFQKLRRILLLGLLSLSGITALLSAVGVVPTVPDQPWVGNLVAVMSLGVAAVAWFWARPRIPLRRATMSTDDYWREQPTMNAAILALFLLEGSATFAIVGTMTAGIGAVTIVAPFPILGMIALTPEWIEQRT